LSILATTFDGKSSDDNWNNNVVSAQIIYTVIDVSWIWKHLILHATRGIAVLSLGVTPGKTSFQESWTTITRVQSPLSLEIPLTGHKSNKC
jgi:hypothetical protein